jgi:hypothetical protein
VNGAEPGDTMEIRITKIVMKDSGFNFNLPGKQFPIVGSVGVRVSRRPFPGTIAVGPDPNEPKEKAGPPIHDANSIASAKAKEVSAPVTRSNAMQARGFTSAVPVNQAFARLERRTQVWASRRCDREGLEPNEARLFEFHRDNVSILRKPRRLRLKRGECVFAEFLRRGAILTLLFSLDCFSDQCRVSRGIRHHYHQWQNHRRHWFTLVFR